MRRLYPPSLSKKSSDVLKKQQRDVDGQPDYEASVARCKQLWEQKTSSMPKKAAFTEIRSKLSEMSPGQRCHYCEDSLADEIEHMRPKDLYPEDAFRWENYVYACGPCNGPKNNKFAVIDAAGACVVVTRPRGAPVAPPVMGKQALIDPRTEDPLEFFALDLHGTFEFVPLEDASDPVRQERAKYTLEVLRLNERDFLVIEREYAYRRYAGLLFEYARIKNINPRAEARLNRIKEAISRERFQSVWVSMQRQAKAGTAPPRLLQLFAIVPEAREW